MKKKTKDKKKKLQITDVDAVIRGNFEKIATYHKENNPDNMDPESLRLLGVHSGVRAALLMCQRKELERIAAHNELTNPPT